MRRRLGFRVRFSLDNLDAFGFHGLDHLHSRYGLERAFLQDTDSVCFGFYNVVDDCFSGYEFIDHTKIQAVKTAMPRGSLNNQKTGANNG